MTKEEIGALLEAEESDSLERKTAIQDRDVARTFCAFANDLPARGGGWLILGQAPDKTIQGLNGDADKLQQTLARIARERCRPAIPIGIQVEMLDGKQVAFVRIDASVARPHVFGECFVRVGSTTRDATDAEIITMRQTFHNAKLRQLQQWIARGDRKVRLQRTRAHNAGEAYLVDANENWISVTLPSGDTITIPLEEVQIGFHWLDALPLIQWFH